MGERVMRKEQDPEKCLRSLRKLARQIFIDRNLAGLDQPGSPKQDLATLKAEVRPVPALCAARQLRTRELHARERLDSLSGPRRRPGGGSQQGRVRAGHERLSCKVSSRSSRASLRLKAALAKELAARRRTTPRLRKIARRSKSIAARTRMSGSRKMPPTRSSPTWNAGGGCRAISDEAHVVVNVPDFTLTVYKDRAPVWHTKIVVGKPGNLANPLLSETMKYFHDQPDLERAALDHQERVSPRARTRSPQRWSGSD